MTLSFAIIGAVTIASAIAAMTLRHLVHCALSLAITFAGLAALYLQLQAQFVGFAQLLVYVGAVAILIVFAILLTRGSGPETQPIYSSRWLAGVVVAVIVMAVLGGTILSSKTVSAHVEAAAFEPSVRRIGDQLMTRYVLPLEVLGLLLTAATIGAVILAIQENRPAKPGGHQ
ncbi:MAG TPA: NADH-quinone oxidoreductase subunit J [Verrucomicrobiae bacterium]|nr:NADH-quinone oxidoreductase subunit J [Verrucomicrobiae bacterium]